MAEYADIGGVRTWYDRRGHGEPVVLLHGGFTDSRDFTGNLDALAAGFTIFLPERRGHGHTPDVDGPLTVELMAQDTIAFLEQIVGRPARVVGYSAGAIVALHLAVRRPDLVERLVLVSGAYSRDGVMVRPTAGQPPPPPLVEVRPASQETGSTRPWPSSGTAPDRSPYGGRAAAVPCPHGSAGISC